MIIKGDTRLKEPCQQPTFNDVPQATAFGRTILRPRMLTHVTYLHGDKYCLYTLKLVLICDGKTK